VKRLFEELLGATTPLSQECSDAVAEVNTFHSSFRVPELSPTPAVPRGSSAVAGQDLPLIVIRVALSYSYCTSAMSPSLYLKPTTSKGDEVAK
jgi:hypothetical protein